MSSGDKDLIIDVVKCILDGWHHRNNEYIVSKKSTDKLKTILHVYDLSSLDDSLSDLIKINQNIFSLYGIKLHPNQNLVTYNGKMVYYDI